MRRALVLLALIAVVTVTAQTPTAPDIIIWLPDELANVSPETLALFGSQADVFARTNAVALTVRVKHTTDTGSILSTLRSASLVAPQAMPTLTLLRRTDLISAYQEALIAPLPVPLLNDLMNGLDTTASLCAVDNVQVGVPFLVDVLHVAYRPQADTDYSMWDFDSVLERGISLQFPGTPVSGLNPVVFLQYLTTNAFTPNDELQYDATTLRQVLNFYQAARETSVVTEETTAYSSPYDYTPAVLELTSMQWVVSASQYLQAKRTDDTLRAAPIPTVNNNLATVLDGWCWVIVPSENEVITQAAAFILQINAGQPMEDIARSVVMLPARTDLFERIASTDDAAFYEQLLPQARLLPADSGSTLIERLIQEAFRAVINGTNAEEAVRAASAQLGG